VIILGAFFCTIAVLVLVASDEYGSMFSFLAFLFFLSFGILFITLDFKAEKNQPVLVEIYKTNKIPVEYKNPEGVKIIVNNVSDGYMYLDNIVLLKEYEYHSKHKVFITVDEVYKIEEIK
jgi:hypothetical protein